MQLADHIKVRGPGFLPGPCRKGCLGVGGLSDLSAPAAPPWERPGPHGSAGSALP